MFDSQNKTEISFITTPYWVLFKKGHESFHEWKKKIDNVETCENFSELKMFCDHILAIDLYYKTSDLKESLTFWSTQPTNTIYCIMKTSNGYMVHPVKPRFFNENEGLLVFWQDGNYELIRNQQAYQLAVTQYYYSENKILHTLDAKQTQHFLSEGIPYLQKLFMELRLSHWIRKPIWIVYAQAKALSNGCSIAMDGSPYYLVYKFVPANSTEEAQSLAQIDFEEDFMQIEKIFEVKLFKLEDWAQYPNSFEDVKNSAYMANEKQCIYTLAYSPDLDL